MNQFEITGQLTLEDIRFLMRNKVQLKLSTQSAKKVADCRAYLDKRMASGDEVIYGVNTGFGSLCDTRISNDALGQLQQNLLLSHACGTGDFVPHEIIKLMLLLKIESLAYGHSGVQLDTVRLLAEFYNHNLLPVVYEQGSLGASGDLAPLEH
jgi:histidine ammonia-lyase